MYFSFRKAKELTRINYFYLSSDQLQKKIVILRDFVRYTTYTTIYLDILVQGGYYVSALTHASQGLYPRDSWLAQNLKISLDEAIKIQKGA